MNNIIENAKKRETSTGTAIVLQKILQKYIHNIKTLAGYMIALDLFLLVLLPNRTEPNFHQVRVRSENRTEPEQD